MSTFRKYWKILSWRSYFGKIKIYILKKKDWGRFTEKEV